MVSCLLGLITLAFAFAPLAHADVAQPVYSATSADCATGPCGGTQQLRFGQGFSGTVTGVLMDGSFTLSGDRDSHGVIVLQVRFYSDSGYTTDANGGSICYVSLGTSETTLHSGTYSGLQTLQDFWYGNSSGRCGVPSTSDYLGVNVYEFGPYGWTNVTHLYMQGASSISSPYSTGYNDFSGVAGAFMVIQGLTDVGTGGTNWGGFPPDNTTTRFTSITPDATTTATTTTIGFEAYINPQDYVSGMTAHVDLYNPTVAALSANVIDSCNIFGAGKCSMDFPITGSTTVASSTSITFNYGGTTKATWSIRRPNTLSSLWLLGSFFNPDTLATRSTSFVVGFQSTFDSALNGDGTATSSDSTGLVGYFTSGGTSSTTPVAQGCAGIFTNGTIVACMVGLIIPTGQDMANNWNQLYNGMLSKVPFGYATRFLTIMSGNGGAVEPPALSYTFGSSSPSELQGRTYTVNIWDYMGSTSPIILAKADDGSNKDIWDIVMPYFNIVITLAVLLAILSDLFGFEMGVDNTQIDGYVKNQSRLSRSENNLAEQAQIQAARGSDNGMGTIKRRKRRY